MAAITNPDLLAMLADLNGDDDAHHWAATMAKVFTAHPDAATDEAYLITIFSTAMLAACGLDDEFLLEAVEAVAAVSGGLPTCMVCGGNLGGHFPTCPKRPADPAEPRPLREYYGPCPDCGYSTDDRDSFRSHACQ